MKVKELHQLVQWLGEARIDVFEVESDDHRLRLVLQPGAVDDGVDQEGGIIVAADMPGLFVTPLVPLGESVRSGGIVALIQIGFVYVPVIASADGTLAKVLTAPGTLVGFGTPLLEIASAVTPSGARGR